MKVIATEIKKLVVKYNISKDDLLIFYKLISSQKKSSIFSKQYGIDEKEIKVLKKKYKIGFIDYGGFVRYLEKSSIDVIKDLDKYVTVESKNQKKEEEKKRKKIEKLDSEIKKREAKIKNRTKAQKNQEKAGGRIILLFIGLIILLVFVFRSCNSKNSDTKNNKIEIPEGSYYHGQSYISFGFTEADRKKYNITEKSDISWVGDKLSQTRISCKTKGRFKINSSNKTITVSGFYNDNCPGKSKLNGIWRYENDDFVISPSGVKYYRK